MKINNNKNLYLSGALCIALLAGTVSFSAFTFDKNLRANTKNILAEDVGVPLKPTDVSPLLIGEKIPAVMLPDAAGKMFNLNEAVTQKPTILVFYRGGWCPFCNKQLAGLQAIEGDLRKSGYQIIAMSTDSPENLTKSMDKHKLSYTLLSDSELSASKKFGLAYVGPASYEKTLIQGSNGKNVDKLLPVPSVFIIDTKGVIRFEYINPNIDQRISGAMLQSVANVLAEEMKSKS